MKANDNLEPYILFHAPGVGSTFPLSLLRVFNVPHELVVCDYEETTAKQGPNYTRLLEANPLAQFPTLITPEGYVMTEMVGIALYLHDRFAKGTTWDIHALAPTQQAAFYRWFIFIPANIYPLLTIIDFPSRFVRVPPDSLDTETVEGWVKAGASAKREELWKMMEREMTEGLKEGTFVLGTQHPTLLDVLLALVAHYTPHPRYSWFEEHCPKLHKNVKETLKTSVIKDVFRENELDDFLQ
ncbi:glutathione transferase [Rhizoctonia solani]|uniref:Glutathione transferase n=1 Tax=Rhizoctonia solani TaxID=456999 RepID=A0A8H7LGK0_9AGAM|nr:glutathione transferase [Rhizoctonia solani]